MGTYDTSIVLEVEVDAIGSPPRLALADDDGGHDLLSELRLSLLDCGHDHVTDTGSGEPVQAGTDTLFPLAMVLNVSIPSPNCCPRTATLNPSVSSPFRRVHIRAEVVLLEW